MILRTGSRDHLRQDTPLPAFNDDSGSVCVIDANGIVVDHFSYDASMHSPFIRDSEGVSLERLSKDAASDDPANWKSGSSSTGYATPGFQNSSSLTFRNGSAEIGVEPEVFVPVSGTPDFATIHYTFEQANQVANVRIYDSSGRKVKTIVQNALLGTSGFFRWEGDLDDGSRARVGNYLIKTELFDQTGLNRVILKRVVVAGGF